MLDLRRPPGPLLQRISPSLSTLIRLPQLGLSRPIAPTYLSTRLSQCTLCPQQEALHKSAFLPVTVPCPRALSLPDSHSSAPMLRTSFLVRAKYPINRLPQKSVLTLTLSGTLQTPQIMSCSSGQLRQIHQAFMPSIGTQQLLMVTWSMDPSQLLSKPRPRWSLLPETRGITFSNGVKLPFVRGMRIR